MKRKSPLPTYQNRDHLIHISASDYNQNHLPLLLEAFYSNTRSPMNLAGYGMDG